MVLSKRVMVLPSAMDVCSNEQSKFANISNDSNSMDAEEGELIDDDFDDPPISCEKVEDKLQLRAKRFGITSTVNSCSGDKTLGRLYSNLGVDKDSRLEALHMFGTDTMKTQDIFEYFAGHTPTSVEWISDQTCNVVWLDEKSAALALLACSVQIKGHNIGGATSASSDSGDEECVNVEDLRLALPPGIWRKGHFRPYAPNVFLRFASRADRRNIKKELLGDLHGRSVVFLDEGDEGIKKVIHETGNPWSDIARQWGRYEQICTKEKPPPVRDARELIKMREDKDISLQSEDREVLPSTKENAPYPDKLIGKMHADIEERKILKRRQLRSPPKLSAQGQIDLRDRLGRKRPRTSCVQLDVSSEGSDEEMNVQPDGIKSRLGGVTWSAFESGDSSDDSDDVEVRPSATDLRQKLMKTSNPPFHPPSPLQIEIDNDLYYSNNPVVTGDS